MQPLSSGQIFTGYHLEIRIGRGGFGQVWETTNRAGHKAALKFIALDGPEVFESSKELRGAKAVLEADGHPNVIQIFDCWEENGYFIIAMELAEPPRTLIGRLNEVKSFGQEGIPRRELLKYVSEAGHGIDHLNDRGIIHHVIKPANLVLINGTCKVADFGFARYVEHSIIVRSKEAGLTIAYAPPEFLLDEPQAVQHRSDQYSLAASYYHLRTGQSLNIFERGLNFEAVREEERSALRRALSNKPSERWTNCGQFVDALIQDVEKAEVAAEKERKKIEDERKAKERLIMALVPGQPETSRLGQLWDRVRERTRPPRLLRGYRWIRDFCKTDGMFVIAILFVVLGSMLAILGAFHIGKIDDSAVISLKDQLEDVQTRLKDVQTSLNYVGKPYRDEYERKDYRAFIGEADQALMLKNPENANRLLDEKCPPALRNWEWHYLKNLFLERTIPGLEIKSEGKQVIKITCVAFDLNNQILASGYENGVVKLWDLPSGKSRLEFKAHSSAIRQIVFQPRLSHFSTLATVENKGKDGTVFFDLQVNEWNMADGTSSRTHSHHAALSVATL